MRPSPLRRGTEPTVTATAEIRVGLRFRRSQVRTLEALITRAKSEGVSKDHITLFEQAQEAARTGEPMIVHCGQWSEAEQLADGFVRYGLQRPAVESLSLWTPGQPTMN